MLLSTILLLASCGSTPTTGNSGTGGGTGTGGETIGGSNSGVNLTVSRTVTFGLPEAPSAEITLPLTLASNVTASVESTPAGLTVTAGKPTQLSSGDTSLPIMVTGIAQPGEVVRVKVSVGGNSTVAELPVMNFTSTPIQATGLNAAYPASSIQFQPDGTALMTAGMNGERAARHGLVRVDTAGSHFTLLPLDNISASGDAISSQATAPDGTVWVTVRGTTAEGSYLLSRDTTGNTHKYVVNAQKDTLNSATIAAGRVWFTQYVNAALKALTPTTGQAQAYPTTDKASSLVRGADGNLYYVVSSSIMQLNPTTGTTRAFNVGEAGRSLPIALTPAPDGSLWFIESVKGTVEQLTPSTSKETTLTLPLNTNPNALAMSPDGQLWISDATNARLYTTYRNSNGQQILVGIATPSSGAQALNIHPSGKAWYEAGGKLYVQQ